MANLAATTITGDLDIASNGVAKVNKITPQSGTTITIGDSGDTISVVDPYTLPIVDSSDPSITTNPSTGLGTLWINSTSGDCYICTDATTNLNEWTNIGEGSGNVVPQALHYLLIAGGGGGGGASTGQGGGGGAGGFLEADYTTSTVYLQSGVTYSVSVGAGGAGGTSSPTTGTNGTDTTLSYSNTTITAIGGGGGGGQGDGQDGGSGGADGGNGDNTGGAGTSGQGNDGGPNNGSGGGAGAAGGGNASAGGIGATTTIINSTNASAQSVGEVSGSDVYFSGGGGAQGDPNGGSGGLGGGGTGAGYTSATTATSGTANTGGGGGAGRYIQPGVGSAGGNGGSGVAILRLPTADYSATTTGSPTVLTEGTDTILIWKSGTGSYTH